MSITKNEKVCINCQECCKWLTFIVKVSDALSYADMYTKRGGEVTQMQDGTLAVLLPSACKYLTNFGCSIYHHRPNWCRKYDGRRDPFMRSKCQLSMPIQQDNLFHKAK